MTVDCSTSFWFHRLVCNTCILLTVVWLMSPYCRHLRCIGLYDISLCCTFFTFWSTITEVTVATVLLFYIIGLHSRILPNQKSSSCADKATMAADLCTISCISEPVRESAQLELLGESLNYKSFRFKNMVSMTEIRYESVNGSLFLSRHHVSSIVSVLPGWRV